MTVRSLADALRAVPDEQLEALLRDRPELLSPVPTDLGRLAARAASGPSAARAMDRLDRFTLQVLEGVCAAAPATGDDVRALLSPAPEPLVDACLDRLLALALVWHDGEAINPVAGVVEVVGRHPAGLGPSLQVLLGSLPPSRLQALLEDLGLPPTGDPGSAIDAVCAAHSDPVRLAAVLASAPAAAAELLDRLAWGPPTGSVGRADREVRAATASSPLDWLLARALLVPVVAPGTSTVVLPREVALHLRGGRAFPEVLVAAPDPVPVAMVDPVHGDRTAGGQAFSFVRLVEDLLDSWGLDAPSVLKSGGLGVRELRRAAVANDAAEWEVALALETAYAAGLVGTSGSLDEEWLPTPAYDLWRADPPEHRWADLAQAWLTSSRTPGAVGERDDRDRALVVLGPDLDRLLAAEVRRGVLDLLAAAGPGAVLDAGAIEAALTWRHPRRPATLRHDLVGWTVREAERLGVTGAGALSGPGRALLGSGDGDIEAAAGTLGPLLPEPVDHVLLQADLTAVAPGPLVTALAHELALAADVESTGGATVYRFTAGSVRRALDAGRTADELHTLLATHSRTPVPQPLTYLVDDVARRHGRIRVGAASAYVRCDDGTVLDELLAHRRTAELRLRRLAPTVLASQAPPELLLARLRELGHAPAGESAEGAVIIRRPDSRRTPTRPPPPRSAGRLAELPPQPPAPGPTLLAAAVRALRAGDRATYAPRGQVVGGMAEARVRQHVVEGTGDGVLPRTAAARTLGLLRAALDEGRPVWIGYVDTHGGVTERVVDPVRLEGGYLTAYDHRYEQVQTFAVHRITGVAELDGADTGA